MQKREKSADTDKEVAAMFQALGDPTRVRIFRYLRERCGAITLGDGEEKWMSIGPTVGEVCAAVTDSKKITAKVSHHIKEMRIAGVIAVHRKGKNMICGVSQRAIDEMAVLLSQAEMSKNDESSRRHDTV